MKPSWEDAPEWAEYLAQDGDGDWYWYDRKPKCCWSNWYDVDAKSERVPRIAFQDTLEKRPDAR